MTSWRWRDRASEFLYVARDLCVYMCWHDRLAVIGYALRDLLWYLPLDIWADRRLLMRILSARIRGKRFDIATWMEVER